MSVEKTSLQQTSDRLVEQQRHMAKEAAVGVISDVFENLVVKAKEDTAKLPEQIFKDHFLPYFSGEKNVTERKEILTEWISIAGSPMAEVNIINNEGETVFAVPPMFDSSVVESVKRKLGESFSDIYAQYTMHSNNLPVVGEKFLADAFEKKLGNTVKKSEVVAQNQHRWEDIFSRYGVAGATGDRTANNNVAFNPSDDVEYD